MNDPAKVVPIKKGRRRPKRAPGPSEADELRQRVSELERQLADGRKSHRDKGDEGLLEPLTGLGWRQVWQRRSVRDGLTHLREQGRDGLKMRWGHQAGQLADAQRGHDGLQGGQQQTVR